MTELRIVEAGAAHAAILAALHAATVGAEEGPAGEGWSREWVARILALPGGFAVLATAPDPLAPEPVGFAACLPAGDAFDLVAIGVLPEHRRAGIGRALLANCEAAARAAGTTRLMLEVAADNAGALAFYRAAGFAEAGRRTGYYRARAGEAPRDALVLSKSL